MAKQLTENQHYLLHQRWPDDCCLCKTETENSTLKQELNELKQKYNKLLEQFKLLEVKDA